MKNQIIVFSFLALIGNVLLGQQTRVTNSLSGGQNAVLNGFGGTWATPSSSLFWKLDYKSGKDLSGNEGLAEQVYTSKNFLPGVVFYKDEEFPNVKVKYNAYSDEIVMKQGEDLVVLHKIKEISCKIGSDKAHYKVFFDKNQERQAGYLFELYKGEQYEVYQKRGKKLKEAKPSANSLHKSHPTRLVDYTEYYVVRDNNQPRYFKNNKKGFFNVFREEQRPKVKDYVKENKLDLNDTNDLSRIFEFAENI